MQQTLTPHRNTRLLALVAATAIALAGCGSDGGGGGGSGTAGGGGGGGGGETTQLVQMFASDFEPACRNNPVEGATPYTPATPGIHKVVTQQGTDADELNEGFLDLPSEWTILFDAATDQYATAELVLCVIRSTTTLVEECTGYQTDGVDTGNVVNLYSADYAVSVHEATTGKELGATTITATATECPTYVTFTDGEKETDWYQTDDGAITDFARPFVET
ncbi:MAG: hypothetical protein KAY11_19855 [Ilumatobacteraceae bacterium]|nr:hypothetical protein [Ilumatobacteraceae bacterium]MBP8211829.1 hypothetical protein [Ilumatobacteraceae bacterium]